MTRWQAVSIAGAMTTCALTGWYAMPIQRRYARWRQKVWRQRTTAARAALLRAIDDGVRAKRKADATAARVALATEMQAEAELNRALARHLYWIRRARGRVA